MPGAKNTAISDKVYFRIDRKEKRGIDKLPQIDDSTFYGKSKGIKKQASRRADRNIIQQ